MSKKLSNEQIAAAIDSLPAEHRVPVAVVARVRGVSVSTVWRWVSLGHFPPPERTGGVSRWRAGDVRGHAS